MVSPQMQTIKKSCLFKKQLKKKKFDWGGIDWVQVWNVTEMPLYILKWHKDERKQNVKEWA